jgi:hypothetical protein
LVEETEESELINISIVAAIDGLEDDVCLLDIDLLLGALFWRQKREAVALAEGALALALVAAGFLVGAMMKDENVL